MSGEDKTHGLGAQPFTDCLRATCSNSVPPRPWRTRASHRVGTMIKRKNPHTTLGNAPHPWGAIDKRVSVQADREPQHGPSPNGTATLSPEVTPNPASCGGGLGRRSAPQHAPTPEPASLHHPGLRAPHFHGNHLLHKRYSHYLLHAHTFQTTWV